MELPNLLILPVGFAVGVLVAAPVGPVNIICIQRAVERGVLGGIAAGAGAVMGDGLIALLAALGVGAITSAITTYRDIIQIIGGLALAAFGIALFASRPRLPAATGRDQARVAIGDYVWDIPKTFLLTITNPGAVLGLLAIFSGISSFVEVRGPVEALAMVGAVMAGSLAWWTGLATVVGSVRHRLDEARLALVNRSAGLLLLAFGCVLIGELIWLKLGWPVPPWLYALLHG